MLTYNKLTSLVYHPAPCHRVAHGARQMAASPRAACVYHGVVAGLRGITWLRTPARANRSQLALARCARPRHRLLPGQTGSTPSGRRHSDSRGRERSMAETRIGFCFSGGPFCPAKVGFFFFFFVNVRREARPGHALWAGPATPRLRLTDISPRGAFREP